MTEYEHEPVRGLPGYLPPGRRNPGLAGRAGLAGDGAPGVPPAQRQYPCTSPCLSSVHLGFAAQRRVPRRSARSCSAAAGSWPGPAGHRRFSRCWPAPMRAATVYTLTDKRLVMRFGRRRADDGQPAAGDRRAADMRSFRRRQRRYRADPVQRKRLSYVMLWPNVRLLAVQSDAARAAQHPQRRCTGPGPWQRGRQLGGGIEGTERGHARPRARGSRSDARRLLSIFPGD
jgi:hypothetical protein